MLFVDKRLFGLLVLLLVGSAAGLTAFPRQRWRASRVALMETSSMSRQDNGAGSAGDDSSPAKKSSAPGQCQQVARTPPQFPAVKNIPPLLVSEIKQFACDVEASCQSTSQDNAQIFGDCLNAAINKAKALEGSYLNYEKYIDDNVKASASKAAIEYVNTQVSADVFNAFKKLKNRFDDTCEDLYKNCRYDAAKFTHMFMKLMSPASASGIAPPSMDNEMCKKPEIDAVFMAEFPNVEHHTRLFKHDIRKSCANRLPNRLDSLTALFRCVNNEFSKVARWCCPYWVVIQRKPAGEFDEFYKKGSPFKEIPDPENTVTLLESESSSLPSSASSTGVASAENDRKIMLEKLQDTFDKMCEQKSMTNKERAECVGKACAYVADGLHRVLHGLSEQVKDAQALGRDHPLNNQE